MATTLTKDQAQAMLLAIGIDNARTSFSTAVKGFQRGWNLGAALVEDGDCGPKTSAALAKSFARKRKGMPTMSAHFSYTEFLCKCGGKFSDCRRVWTLRTHVRRLEAYRSKIGMPVRVVSGCRCPQWNSSVGGASQSQHKFGAASDIQGVLKVDRMRALGQFAGMGFQRSTGLVVHVDSRDVSGANTTGGRQGAPTTWQYAA